MKTPDELDRRDELLISPRAMSEVRRDPARQVGKPLSALGIESQEPRRAIEARTLTLPQDQVHERGVWPDRTPHLIPDAYNAGGDAPARQCLLVGHAPRLDTQPTWLPRDE